MSKYAMSIGEPESSQDTPLRNTTPAGKRRVNRDPRSTPAKKGKKNQCQTFFDVMVTTREMEDLFDPIYHGIDKLLNNVDEDLSDDEGCMQEAQENNDELLLLIQQLENKSAAAERSNDRLRAEVSEFGTTSGGQRSNSADIDMPDSDEYQDGLIVQEHTKTHGERVDALQRVLKSHGMIKQQVEDFRGELRQARGEFPAQINKLRFEYEARLSQQRRELKEKARERKEQLKHELDEKQQIIDKMTETAASVQQLKLADAKADAAIAELSSKLAAAEAAKKDAISELSETEKTLETVARNKADWKAYGEHQCSQNKELCEELEGVRAKSASKLRDVNRRLEATKCCLSESQACANQTRKQLDDSMSDYATLLTDVALVQKQKLCVARSQKTQLNHYLDQARSMIGALEGTVDGLHTKLNGKVTQVERRDQLLAQKNALLNSKHLSMEYLERQLETNKQSLQRKDRTISEDWTQIRRLERTRMELEAQLNIKDGLLTSNATKISGKVREIQDLKEQASRAAKELAGQRSLITEKAKRVDELEDINKDLDAAMTKLRSKLGSKESDLNTNVSVIRSQTERIQRLDSTIQSLLQEKAQADAAIAQLKADLFNLNMSVNTKSNELTSQTTLVNQRDAKIRDLDLTLSRTQKDATSQVKNLQNQLSDLKIELISKDEKLGSQASAAALKDERIQVLEAANADLLRAQGEAKKENVFLQADIENADGRLDSLQAELKVRDSELRIANEKKEHVRRRLEEVETDLSAEKSANKTASLETLVKNAYDKIETLSTDLYDKTQSLEKEKLDKYYLVRRIDRLETRAEEERLKYSEEKKDSDWRLEKFEETISLNQDTIRNLQAEASSNQYTIRKLQRDVALSSNQLQNDRILYNTERGGLLRQLIAQSTQSHNIVDQLPEDLTDLIRDMKDVRVFLGVLAGKKVLVRAQRFHRERKALIIVGKSDHTRIMWHESLERFTVDMDEEGHWYLRLEKEPKEAPIDIRFDDVDPYELEDWLKKRDAEIGSG